MLKIKLLTDSSSDLSKELQEQFNIGVLPFNVVLNDNEYLDGVNITTEDLYSNYEKNKTLPKTAALNSYTFVEYFKKFAKDYDLVVYTGISGGLSATYENAVNASKEFKNVLAVDSKSLSSGISLLLLKLSDLIVKCKTIEEYKQKAVLIADKIQASFVIETLEFLYKGGRCSMLKLLGANMFHIKPGLDLIGGKIVAGKKYRGKQVDVIKNYIDYTLSTFPNYEKDYCFITHTKMDKNLVDMAIEMAKKAGFKNVYEGQAGCAITTHCGAGTIGILYVKQ